MGTLSTPSENEFVVEGTLFSTPSTTASSVGAAGIQAETMITAITARAVDLNFLFIFFILLEHFYSRLMICRRI
jgi:hypothetical protein